MEELLTLSLSIIYTTVTDKTQASIIVKQLVKSDMILCGNIITNAISFFKWDGDLKSEGECVILMKCFSKNSNQIIDKIEEIHPYEIPLIFSIDINQCNSKYLTWLR
jgi:periplasmic divalent cation tolerance protein